jgi:hypothetical protein
MENMEISTRMTCLNRKPTAHIEIFATPEECANDELRTSALVEFEKRLGLIGDLHLGHGETAAFETIEVKA